MRVSEDMIGGAYVLRAFNRGSERVGTGQTLTRDEVLAIPPANRKSLIDNGQIAVYPPAAGVGEQGELMIYSLGFGKFDVVRGTKVNEAALSKEEAEALVQSLQPVEAEPAPAQEPAIN